MAHQNPLPHEEEVRGRGDDVPLSIAAGVLEMSSTWAGAHCSRLDWLFEWPSRS